jgi:cobalamin biosynthesis protein CbiG
MIETAQEAHRALMQMLDDARASAAARTDGNYTDVEKLVIGMAAGITVSVKVDGTMARVQSDEPFDVVVIDGKLTVVTTKGLPGCTMKIGSRSE